jgi:pimeloyl-ACP methyl ester carboxylesterase
MAVGWEMSTHRRRVLRTKGYAGVVAAVLAIGFVPAVADPASAAPASAPASATASATQSRDLRIGSVVLKPCSVVAHAFCGHIDRPWDPTGRIAGTLSVGFAFVPARDAALPVLGTVVPHEGGPGYSTTDSGSSYASMYGPLLARRNLLLVDQRGTGLSAPIVCPRLDVLTGPYDVAAAACARKLGDHANLYGTALSADDLAAVIRALGLGRVDVYGDSYGTFFSQVFAGRHPDLLRSVVLDSAYPTYGETAWYPTQTAAMLQSIDLACSRTPACASRGTVSAELIRVLAQVRKDPYRGTAPDAAGVSHSVTVDAPALVSVVFGATYGPYWYRELGAALRAALAGDRKPLLRLVAEAVFGGGGGVDDISYSEGADAAVSCHDYPQLYDMTATPAVRAKEFAASVRREQQTDPAVYAPFTIAEYIASDWEEVNWCLTWPVAPSWEPAGPPVPPGGHYAGVPVLVLSGELDSITTPAEGAIVVSQFPDARQVIVANSFHVTADGDTDNCAVRILRAFVTSPASGLTGSVLACAAEVPPLRAVGFYARSFTSTVPAVPGPGSTVSAAALRAAATAALTAADVLDRWPNNYTGSGAGLYGGTWSYSGDAVTTFVLKDVRLVRDLEVSGTISWGRYSHALVAHLRLRQVDASGRPVAGSAVDGSVDGAWDTRASGAMATLTGVLGGKVLRATMLAP